MTTQSPTITDAVHVVPSRSVLPGAMHNVTLCDNLAIGPCHQEPQKHGEVRKAFWTSFYDSMLLHSPRDRRTVQLRREYQQHLERDIFSAERFRDRLLRFSSSLPVVVWTTQAWSDRLTLWWVAEMIRQFEVGIKHLWICEPHSPNCSDPQRELPLGGYAEHELAEMLAEARRMTDDHLDEAARLWRAFADSDPVELDELRRTASSCFPTLQAELEPHRYGFPRMSPDNRLLLSELDDLLFRAMRRDGWVRPVDILIGTPTEDRILRYYRDHFVAYRLHQWHRHDLRTPILVAERREGANSLTRIAYQLTDRGNALLSLGLRSLDDAPPMEIGGCCAYGTPWVVHTMAGEWRVRRVA